MPVDPRVLRGALAQHEHIGIPVLPLDDLLEHRPSEKAQHCARAARFHRRQVAAVQCRIGVADRVDSPMQRVQPAVVRPYRDRIE